MPELPKSSGRHPKAILDVDDVNFGRLAPLLDRKIDLVIARGGRGFSSEKNACSCP
jgi:hypothetical protein